MPTRPTAPARLGRSLQVATRLINPEGLNSVGGVFPPEVSARWSPLLRVLGTCYAALALTGAALQSNPSDLHKTCARARSPQRAWGRVWKASQATRARARSPPATPSPLCELPRVLPTDPVLEFFKNRAGGSEKFLSVFIRDRSCLW